MPEHLDNHASGGTIRVQRLRTAAFVAAKG
jgi:hypothetical protein